MVVCLFSWLRLLRFVSTVCIVRPTHHSPFRVLRASHMLSRPGSVSASLLGSTSTAVCCLSLTSNSSPPDIGRSSFLHSLPLSWKLAAICNRQRSSEADIARERKLLQLTVICLCDRFGISQDRLGPSPGCFSFLFHHKSPQPFFLHECSSSAASSSSSMRRRLGEFDESFSLILCCT